MPQSGAFLLIVSPLVFAIVSRVHPDNEVFDHATALLRTTEERLRLALQAGEQGIYDLNVQTGEAIVSPEYAIALGFDPDTFVETNARWIERLHPDDREPVAKAYQDYVGGRLPTYRVEFRQLTRDGRWKWILSLGSIVEYSADGRPLRMLGTHTDISERKAAEAEILKWNAQLEDRVHARTAELEAANQALEAFSYSVSHDLRAPLRAIHGYAGMLAHRQADRLDDEGRRMLTVIRAESERMGYMIEDLLRFARLRGEPLTAARVGMDGLVEEVVEELRKRASIEGISLEWQPLPDAYGERSLLRQVWMNLLDNAAKFTRGRSKPKIWVEAASEPGGTIYRVRDNGIGFDPAKANRLFEPFERLHSEADYEGSGIGLAMVGRIVERHGGRVGFESRPGAGTTIWFFLPDLPDENGMAPPDPKDIGSGTPRAR